MKITNTFIDIHTHILPGVDDGSENMEETIRMLHLANNQHIETIIATPHYVVGAKNPTVDQLQQIREQVQEEAEKINQNMSILLGNELFYSTSILDALKSKEALTLAGSRYILIEFSPRESYNIMYQGLVGLIRAGYIPIIAHIERYYCLEKKEYLISELIEAGCYIQMNSNSMVGGIFDMEARRNTKLVKQGLVHFIASDCHDHKLRIPVMRSTVEALQKRCDESLLHKLFYTNPVSVLENTYLS